MKLLESGMVLVSLVRRITNGMLWVYEAHFPLREAFRVSPCSMAAITNYDRLTYFLRI